MTTTTVTMMYKILMPVIFFLFILTGDLECFKKQAFILKEGVEYKIKISFKVSAAVGTAIYMQWNSSHPVSRNNFQKYQSMQNALRPEDI